MLGEPLDVVPPLHHVQGDVGAVAAAEGVARPVEVESPGVPAPFGEELEHVGPGMIAPDALLELDAADPGRHRAPLGAVEPAVGPPLHRVDRRVRVLHAEPREQDLGVAVGLVVLVRVGIEEQVRRLADEDPAVADRQAARQVQPLDEDRGLVGLAVAVGVLEDLDPVDPSGPRGGGSGNRSYSVRRYWSTLTGFRPAGLGYCRYSMTHARPRSSKHAVTGCRIIGSLAKTSTWNPSGTTMRARASSGVYPPALACSPIDPRIMPSASKPGVAPGDQGRGGPRWRSFVLAGHRQCPSRFLFLLGRSRPSHGKGSRAPHLGPTLL